MYIGQIVDRHGERNKFGRSITFTLSRMAGTSRQEQHLLNYLEETRREARNPFRRKCEPAGEGARAAALKEEAEVDSNNLPLTN